MIENGSVAGVICEDGREFSARSVVLTTGTFLNGLIHIGEKRIPAGRHGEPPAHGFSEQLKSLGLAAGPAQNRNTGPA